MNGNFTNIYYILKQKYPNIVQLGGREKEFFSFLGHNCRNYILDRTKSTNDNLYFSDISKAYKTLLTYTPPQDTNVPTNPVHLFSFSPIVGSATSFRKEAVTFCLTIDNSTNIPQYRTICLKVNDHGVFIEVFNLIDKIETYYYDAKAKRYIFENYLNIAGNDQTSTYFILKFLERRRKNLSDIDPTNLCGLKPDYALIPDYKFTMTNNSTNVMVKIEENGETIDIAEIAKPFDTAFYTAYYDFMVNHELFEPNEYPVRIKV